MFQYIRSFFVSPAGIRYSLKDWLTPALTDAEWAMVASEKGRTFRLYVHGVINDKELARLVR